MFKWLRDLFIKEEICHGTLVGSQRKATLRTTKRFVELIVWY